MKDDFYYLDEENYMVIGHRNKTSYRLGDKVKVLVKKIDIGRKQMDLELV
jgi:ribonuclease R